METTIVIREFEAEPAPLGHDDLRWWKSRDNDIRNLLDMYSTVCPTDKKDQVCLTEPRRFDTDGLNEDRTTIITVDIPPMTTPQYIIPILTEHLRHESYGGICEKGWDGGWPSQILVQGG